MKYIKLKNSFLYYSTYYTSESEEEIPSKKRQKRQRRLSNKKSGNKNKAKKAETQSQWIEEDISLCDVPLRVRYESFVHNEHSEWLYDKEFTPVMLFQLLFGKNFERIREGTERYG